MSIFVFGSNLAGRHGAGAALDAIRFHGARWGRGEGRQGGAYAIPTKDHALRPLPLDIIERKVETFIQYAREHFEFQFLVTRIGCGLAGYKDADIAPMFANAPLNCILDQRWIDIINKGREGNGSQGDKTKEAR